MLGGGTRFGTSCIAADLDLLLEGRGRPWIRVFEALGQLVSLQFLPVLVLSPAEQNVTGLERTVRLLAELAAAQPGAALVLPVEQGLFDSYVVLAPASRAKALLRESVINLPRPDLIGAADSLLVPREAQEFTSGDLALTIWNLESWICNQTNWASTPMSRPRQRRRAVLVREPGIQLPGPPGCSSSTPRSTSTLG